MKNNKFQLLKYFSLTSLSAFIVAIFFLGYFYRQQSLDDLISLGEKQNVAVAKAFSNSLRSEFTTILEKSEQLNKEKLRAHPQIAALDSAAKLQMEGLHIVKIKIFNKQGKVIFSTDKKQIGLSSKESKNFQAAMSGEIVTRLVSQGSYGKVTENLEKRQLLSSYIPIQHQGLGSEIEGVFELYSDVTPLIEKIERTQKQLQQINQDRQKSKIEDVKEQPKNLNKESEKVESTKKQEIKPIEEKPKKVKPLEKHSQVAEDKQPAIAPNSTSEPTSQKEEEKLSETPVQQPVKEEAIKPESQQDTLVKEAEVSEEKTPSSKENLLANKKIVILGNLTQIDRDKAKTLIQKAGGNVAGSPNANTDYIVVGKAPGDKLKKAQKLGIPQLSETQFLELLKNFEEPV